MKLSRCRGCKKIIDRDPFGQPEFWPCIVCDAEMCVWCYHAHTPQHFHDIYPELHNPDGSLKNEQGTVTHDNPKPDEGLQGS